MLQFMNNLILVWLNASLLDKEEKKLFDIEQIMDKLIDLGIDLGKNLLGAILIYIIGRFAIKQIGRLLAKILEGRKLEVSVQTFLRSLVNLLLNLVLAFAIISKLGVETTSLAALLASAGVAIGILLASIVGMIYGYGKKDKQFVKWSVIAFVIDVLCALLFWMVLA